jgi:PD-(D/E)XK nuclease superfamily
MREISRTDWRSLPFGYLSPSQCWSYLACPACYEAERILRIPKPVSADLMVGRFTHAAVAHMRQRMNEEPWTGAADEADLEAGAQAFDEVITRQVDVEETGEESPIEIELTKKYGDLGEAKDVAVNVTRHVLPLIAKYDRVAGVLAAEARVRHLGPSFHGYPELFQKLSPDEQEDAREESEEQFVGNIKPVFPFPFKAILDVLYANGWLKDLKTASKLGSPDMLASLQLLTYDLPFWMAGEPHRLAWDVAVKTKKPDFATYYLNDTGEVSNEQYAYARYKTLWVADQICAGNFPVNEGGAPWSHKYEHDLPTGTRAAMEDWAIPQAISA